MNNKKKGQFGYRNQNRKMHLVLVTVLLLAILAQLGARSFTDSKAAKNILTVMAILTVLPMANLASPLLASWKYKSVSPQFYELCRPHEKDYPILYDLVITSKEQILPVDAAAIHPSGIYLYCPAQKIDIKKAETFLNEMLAGWRLDQNARLITEEKTFLKRLDSLESAETDDAAEQAVRLLKSLSM